MGYLLPHQIVGEPGSRDPILLLHGFLGSKSDWQEVSANLVGDFRTIAVDLPGHGENLWCDGNEYSMEKTGEAIVRLLDHLEIERVNVAGYSMGGRLALYFVHAFPERCRKAVLESASPGLKTKAERAARRSHDGALADKIESDGIASFVDEWYKQPLFSDIVPHRELFNAMKERRLKNNSEGTALSLRFAGSGAQRSLWDELVANRLPLLLITGENDTKFCRIAAEMARLCPAAEVCIIEEAGHMVHALKPNLYSDCLRKFLLAD